MTPHSARKLILAAAAISAFACAPRADAASKFDGDWSVVINTSSGGCTTYRFGGQIRNGIIYYAGGAPVNVSGRVQPSGVVHVTVSSGGNHAVGSGRLSTNSGSGRWHGSGPAGSCAGTWSASRG